MKQKSTAIILCLFLGAIGVHKFYLGKSVQGLLYLVFFITGIPLLLAILDLIQLALTSEANFNKEYNPQASSPESFSKQSDDSETLERLESLRDKGILTSQEFEAKKNQIEDKFVDPVRKLEKLAKLRNKGIISQEDFDSQKQELLKKVG